MEKVDTCNETIKVSKAASTSACATTAEPTVSQLDKLIAEHAEAKAAFEQTDGTAANFHLERMNVLGRLIAGFRCRSATEMATKVNVMLRLADEVDDGIEPVTNLGRYGLAILNSMLDAPDYSASRDKATFDAMSAKQKQAVLSALVDVRESLMGALNQPRVDGDEDVHGYVDDLFEQTNGRIDTLYHSLLDNRPQNDDERVDWLTAIVSYLGKLEWQADEIGYDVPELFDELKRIARPTPTNAEQDSAPAPTPSPEIVTQGKLYRGLTDFSGTEKQLLDCLESVVVRDERGEDKSLNEEGYALLDKIHSDVSDVFLANIEARTISNAGRPCESIADVKDRVALLLAATYDEMESTTVNDVFIAVRNSILTFAREGVTQ